MSNLGGALGLLVLSFCLVHMFSTLFEAGLTVEKRKQRDSWKRRYPSLSVVAKGAKLVESSARGLARLIEEMHATCADEWTGTAPLYPPQGTDEEI